MTEVWPCPVINAPTSPGTEAQRDAFCPTSLRKVLLQLLQHHVRLRKLEFAWGPLLKTRPELRAAAVGAQQRHLEAAPPRPGGVHLHRQLGGLQAQRLAQGRGVAPVDSSARAVLDDDARPLHSPFLAAGRLLPLLGRSGQRRLGLPLPPARRHGAWGPVGDRAPPRAQARPAPSAEPQPRNSAPDAKPLKLRQAWRRAHTWSGGGASGEAALRAEAGKYGAPRPSTWLGAGSL